jgi:hypothetical protein
VRAHPVAILVAIGLGALGVVFLWWSDTPAVSNFGEWVTNAGRVLGLLAGYGVVGGHAGPRLPGRPDGDGGRLPADRRRHRVGPRGP